MFINRQLKTFLLNLSGMSERKMINYDRKIDGMIREISSTLSIWNWPGSAYFHGNILKRVLEVC